MPREIADAVVIGGGIMGVSTGCFLAAKGFGKIVLLEKATLASASTGASAANLRTYYSNPASVQLALRSLEMFERDVDELGGDCGFEQIGLLLLLDEEREAMGEAVLEVERSQGAEARKVSVEEIRTLAPQLDLEGISTGIFEPRSGYADPVRTTENLVRRGAESGLETRLGSAATAIVLEGDRVAGVQYDRGSIETGVVVNAAGPWAARIGASIGLNYSLRWSRESDLIVRAPSDFGAMPVVSDTTLRTYFRPHAQQTVLAGLGYPKEIEPLNIDDYHAGLDPAVRRRIEERLFRRVPALQLCDYHHGYSSIYTITDDWHPIVGPEPGLGGYYACFGGSGHAFKLAPALGEALADVITGGEPAIPIHAFRPARFREGETFSSAWGSGNRA